MPGEESGLVKDDSARIVAAIRALASKRVMVGVPAGEALRKPEAGEPSTVNNAMLAYIHENGCPAAHIPPRPFLKPAVTALQPEIERGLKNAAALALKGDEAGVDKALHGLGLIAQAAVRNKINEGIPPPLAESTLRARRARGRTGTKSLIDTGQLRNAITYVIRKVHGL